MTSYGTTELRAGALDALYQGIVVTDARAPDCPIVYANDAFLRLTGYRRDEVVGRNCRMLQGRGTDQRVLDDLRAALADDQPFFGQLLNYRRDGTAFWNALSIVPLHDEDGVTSHLLGSQTDVTSLREAEILAEQHGRLEVLDSFARGVAHDFNNVLLAASGYAELLSNKLTEPGQDTLRRFAQQIVSSCESGRQLTQQLLGSSRTRTAIGDVVDVGAVTAETIALVQRLLPSGVTLQTAVPLQPATVAADRALLQQVLFNVLVNARDAVMPSGTIVVSVSSSGTTVDLQVEDTGSGDDRPADAFFTSDDAGNGLGLLTTNAIVRRLGGTVDVRARDGGGTTTVVSLPRYP